MDLKKIYYEVKIRIDKVDFNKLWNNFKRIDFAVYNNEEVCLNGEIFKKTDEFIANTSINYHGKTIAIFMVDDNENMDILASKMIHEMYHGFQNINNEKRFPNELEAVIKYKYDESNLSLKYQENKIICELVNDFDINKFQKLLSIRKERYIKYPYEYTYEAKIEQIEGCANYIELKSLEIINKDLYNKKISNMIKVLSDINYLMPIRIISYDIGALLLLIMNENNIKYDDSFIEDAISIQILKEAKEYKESFIINNNIKNKIVSYYQEAKEIIQTSKLSKPVFEGEAELLGVNVYDAKAYDNNIISTYFVMYKENEENHILEGNFVIEYINNVVKKIYRY